MPLAFEKMTPEQRIAAIKYKAKVQRLDAIPSRTNKLLGLAGWGSAIRRLIFLVIRTHG